MDTDRIARLMHLLDRSGTRRTALIALLGMAIGGGTLGADAAKRQPKGKASGKRDHRGKHTRKNSGDASTQANKKEGNHCIAPNGDDLNAIYQVSAHFVAPFCSRVGSGEQWVSPGPPWFVNDTFESVPAGFVPGGATPREDFFAKFSEIKYVVDPGTKKEQIVVFPNDGNLFSGPGDLFTGIPADWFVVGPVSLGTLHPLPVGEHTADVFWVLSAMHCDGVGDSVDDNCLPAGEFAWGGRRMFEVVPGHN